MFRLIFKCTKTSGFLFQKGFCLTIKSWFEITIKFIFKSTASTLSDHDLLFVAVPSGVKLNGFCGSLLDSPSSWCLPICKVGKNHILIGYTSPKNRAEAMPIQRPDDQLCQSLENHTNEMLNPQHAWNC